MLVGGRKQNPITLLQMEERRETTNRPNAESKPNLDTTKAPLPKADCLFQKVKGFLFTHSTPWSCHYSHDHIMLRRLKLPRSNWEAPSVHSCSYELTHRGSLSLLLVLGLRKHWFGEQKKTHPPKGAHIHKWTWVPSRSLALVTLFYILTLSVHCIDA